MLNVHNTDDNEWFKWCLVRHLHPAGHNPRNVTKAGKDLAKKVYFEDCQSKLQTFTKLKKIILSALVFWIWKQRKISNLCVKKFFEEKHVDVLLTGEESKSNLSNILIQLCMIIRHTVEDNIFVVIVYTLLVQKKY